MTVREAATAIGERLVSSQLGAGAEAGAWPKESEFTGSITAGMVGAYLLTCHSSYLAAAERGANYSRIASGGNYYGDEAYALCRLSEVSTDRAVNPWRQALATFFARVKNSSTGTQGYVAQFATIDPADAAFYLAHHVVAAYYVDAADKQLWRDALVDALSRISDSSCVCPVAGMAIATWALAKTGPLDATRIDRSDKTAAYWKERTLVMLPGLLCGHQVPAGEMYAGSLYARFDHGLGPGGSPRSGYTEDLVFGLMALAVIRDVGSDAPVESAMTAARQALLDQLPEDGRVRQHLWLTSDEYYVYAGEVLQALEAAAVPGDVDLDGSVDLDDFARMATQWMSPSTAASCEGSRADSTGDRTVDFRDLAALTNHWLVPVGSRSQDNE